MNDDEEEEWEESLNLNLQEWRKDLGMEQEENLMELQEDLQDLTLVNPLQEEENDNDQEDDVVLWEDVLLFNNNLPPSTTTSTSPTLARPSTRRPDTSILTTEGAKLNMNSLEYDLSLLSPHTIATQFTQYNCTTLNDLQTLLAKGSHARSTLIRSNLRLVVSVCKSYMNGANSEGMPSSMWNKGGWNRPSLDEVIQEGILGLVRAVDKWQVERGLKFGTYATYWIKSYARICMQNAETGCLKIPENVHLMKDKYYKLLRKKKELSLPVPTMEEAALEMGMKPIRLRTALTVTSSLISLDESLTTFSAALKGSSAGGDTSTQRENTLADLLEETSEASPEDYVDRLMLRQALENAMAMELSPHERDILRMRSGLDDGRVRTVREIVNDFDGMLSKMDVYSTERKAFAKLRSPLSLHTHGLLGYLQHADIDEDIDTFR